MPLLMHAVYPFYRELLLSFLIALRISTSFHRLPTLLGICHSASRTALLKATFRNSVTMVVQQFAVSNFKIHQSPSLSCRLGNVNLGTGVPVLSTTNANSWLRRLLQNILLGTGRTRTCSRVIHDWLQYYLETDAPEVSLACRWGCVKLWSVSSAEKNIFCRVCVSIKQNKNPQTSGKMDIFGL